MSMIDVSGSFTLPLRLRTVELDGSLGGACRHERGRLAPLPPLIGCGHQRLSHSANRA
jgi:hypothetical protein